MSDNFVRRNLKSRGTVKYKKPRTQRETQRRERELDERTEALLQDSGSEGEIEPRNKGGNKPGENVGGLSSWGVDPLSLSLEWIRKHHGNALANSNHSREVQADPTEQKFIRGLHVSEKQKKRKIVTLSDSRTYTTELLAVLQQMAPKCNGHQMPARLLTVSKTGKNKVEVINFSPLFNFMFHILI